MYQGLLANQGLTPTGFESLQREQLEVLDLQSGIADSTFLTPTEFRRYIELYNQRREVGYALFEVDAFSPQVEIDDAAIAAHYESNQQSYQTVETVDLEYVELAQSDIAATIEVTEEGLRAFYDEERERFSDGRGTARAPHSDQYRRRRRRRAREGGKRSPRGYAEARTLPPLRTSFPTT